METTIKFVDPVVKPGREINCVPYSVSNYRLHQVLDKVGKMIIMAMESKSANSMASMQPRDTKMLLAQWNVVATTWAQLKQYRNLPTGMLEAERVIGIPHENELAQVANEKISPVCWELRNLADVLVGLDAVALPAWTEDGEIAQVEEVMQAVGEIMGTWIGTGNQNDLGYDTGLVVPRSPAGKLIPDLDRDAVTLNEPSTDLPTSALPDVKDLPSIAVPPGGSGK